MDAPRRFTGPISVAVAITCLALGNVTAARADQAGTSGAAALYLGGTCLCDTVPDAQSALGLAGGYLDDVGPITGIGYPAGLLFSLDSAVGATVVSAHLDAEPGDTRITLAGVSQGAIVLDYVKQALALRLITQPQAGQLSFVTFGDPMNSTGGIVARNPLLWFSIPPGLLPTSYSTTEIVREYDGISDWPDRPTALSVMNALMGVAYVHPFYGADADPDTPGTIKTVRVNAAGGTTTHYLIPTAQLPITAPLRSVGMDTTTLDDILRPQIDGSYAVRPQSAPRDGTPDPETSVVSSSKTPTTGLDETDPATASAVSVTASAKAADPQTKSDPTMARASAAVHKTHTLHPTPPLPGQGEKDADLGGTKPVEPVASSTNAAVTSPKRTGREIKPDLDEPNQAGATGLHPHASSSTTPLHGHDELNDSNDVSPTEKRDLQTGAAAAARSPRSDPSGVGEQSHPPQRSSAGTDVGGQTPANEAH